MHDGGGRGEEKQDEGGERGYGLLGNLLGNRVIRVIRESITQCSKGGEVIQKVCLGSASVFPRGRSAHRAQCTDSPVDGFKLMGGNPMSQ